jgi:hypothetical protein
VSWDARAFDGFRHGYAGTIYKGQGRTIDHTYLYHSHHWRQASSYVALTRQRERATIFAATETAPNLGALARQMDRTEVRAASVAWLTTDELPPALRARAEASAQQSERPMPIAPIAANPAERTAPATSKPMTTKPVAHDSPVAAPAQEWLIAPRESAPPDPAERAAAVASDATVRRERAGLDQYLAGTFVDPQAARERLNALVERDGQTSAARRIAADPAQLGELRGRTGLLAGSAARGDRARAEKVAGAIVPAMMRITDAEAAAASRYDQRIAADVPPRPSACRAFWRRRRRPWQGWRRRPTPRRGPSVGAPLPAMLRSRPRSSGSPRRSSRGSAARLCARWSEATRSRRVGSHPQGASGSPRPPESSRLSVLPSARQRPMIRGSPLRSELPTSGN